MNIRELIDSLSENSGMVGELRVAELLDFVTVSCRLLPSIKILLRTASNNDECPLDLPDEILVFLSRATKRSVGVVSSLWTIARLVIWDYQSPDVLRMFAMYGKDFQLGYRDVLPPIAECDNPNCPHLLEHGERFVLREPRRHEATLFTRDEGPLPAFSTSLACRPCGTRYYCNYAIRKAADGTAERLYYAGIPDVIQVADHYFMETQLCLLYKNMLVFSAVAATSFVRIYELSYEAREVPGWPWKFSLRPEYVWDGFTVLSLLQDCEERGAYLVVPDGGSNLHRFDEAMKKRNKAMIGTGQEYYMHACSICLQQFVGKDGKLKRMHAAVSDGTAVGHFKCSVHNCQIPLENKRVHYCPPHSHLETICRVTDCSRKRAPGRRTCDLDEHMVLDTQYDDRSRAWFQLHKRLQRAGISGEPSTTEEADELLDTAVEEDEYREFCEGKGSGGPRVKTRFGRSRTHSEQLLVRPCGIVIARATFYSSEAVSDVVNFWKVAFPTPQSIPQVLFYDTNCKVKQHLDAQKPPDCYFARCALPVDVWHFKSKHKERDGPCNTQCNPRLFPELTSEPGKWRFNSSAAEQANLWFGKYYAIAREMLPDRYNFFLDEMIKERNRFTVEELERRGQNPVVLPEELFFPATQHVRRSRQ